MLGPTFARGRGTAYVPLGPTSGGSGWPHHLWWETDPPMGGSVHYLHTGSVPCGITNPSSFLRWLPIGDYQSGFGGRPVAQAALSIKVAKSTKRKTHTARRKAQDDQLAEAIANEISNGEFNLGETIW